MTRIRYSNLSIQPAPPPRRRSFGKFLGLVIVAVLGLLLFKVGLDVRAADHAAALETAHQRQLAAQNFKQTANQVINSNPQINFSVSLIDLSANISLDLGLNQPVDAASVGKLLTAALFFHKVELGQASLNQQVNGYKASYELKQLINQSDDNAWLALNDYLGHSALSTYAIQLGLGSYNVANNLISTHDMASFLKLLYSGKLLSSAHTHQLLSYMQNTNYEDFITPAILSGDQFFHKVGLDGDEVNDAGLIVNNHQTIALVIFTNGNGTQDWPDRAAMMQQIAKAAEQAYL